MSDPLSKALADPGPHTVDSLAERLPAFPAEAIRDALEALAAQGVLERSIGSDGKAEYRYIAPERYTQADLDVIRNPGKPHNRRRGIQ
jgi:predicted ArsR family transcriptional regulator